MAGTHHLVDARGSFCPGPLMELIAAMRHAAVGDTFELLSSDRGSAREVPEWTRKARHATDRVEQDEAGVWHLFVTKTR